MTLATWTNEARGLHVTVTQNHASAIGRRVHLSPDRFDSAGRVLRDDTTCAWLVEQLGCAPFEPTGKAAALRSFSVTVEEAKKLRDGFISLGSAERDKTSAKINEARGLHVTRDDEP